MHNPAFTSDLVYSVQNEDYRSELAVLARLNQGRPLRVLMIASAGENALSLLTHEQIASIDAVDLNLAQLHLCELRRTALLHRSRDEQLRLFGVHPVIGRVDDEAARLALYDGLRPSLPDATRAFWDGRRLCEIAFGLHHVGRNDKMMHDLQERLKGAGFAPLQRLPGNHELATWQGVYEELGTPAYMQDLFRLPNPAIAQAVAKLAPAIAEGHFHALQQPAPERNPYLTTVFADSYATAAGEEGYPLYLQEKGQALLRHLGVRDRLHLHHGNIIEIMAPLVAQDGPFDLISLSNIADWMNEAQLCALLQQAAAALRPGGGILARTASLCSPLGAVMRQQLQTDHALNAELPQIERGPWFRTIVAGFRPKS
ncbi:MAG: DUF3419 family protein [Caldilineaceae bacterium]